MRRLIASLAIAAAAAALAPAAAQAEFGLSDFRVSFTDKEGFPETRAGSHPFAMTTSFRLNFSKEGGKAFPDGRLRDAFLRQIAGLVGDATAYPRCTTADFLAIDEFTQLNKCPVETAVGISAVSVITPDSWGVAPVFNLVPPPGVAARLGFRVVLQNVFVDVSLDPDSHELVASSRNVSEVEPVFGSVVQLWGDPSDPEHDRMRGKCTPTLSGVGPGEELEFLPGPDSCPTTPRSAFLTLPTRCAGANVTAIAADAWERPGSFLANGLPNLADPSWVTASFESPPFTGCGALPALSPSIEAKPTSKAAQSPTGLDFSLDVKDEGIKNPDGLAKSEIRKAVVTLPEGMSANPSVAEGLEVCSEADLAREKLGSAPGEGCPEASKIGTIEVRSPLVDEALSGALYQATPYDNLAGDSLIAFYMVIKNPNLGIIVKQPTGVAPDPTTGQLIATADEIPQLPFSHFALHFREGGRSPLISPPRCGSYEAKAVLTPWSGGPEASTTSAFTIASGPDEGPCPSGPAPFHPGFEAGTNNNAAGRFSPFYMRLTRKDGEQDMTRFSATLPPGVVARLAGTSRCPEAAIAAAKAKSGLQERAAPSCPTSSEIGRVLGGAGVGSQLTYVPGKLYLAGPSGGAPLSVVAIVPAVAGPFDVGNVVVRQALRINPRSAVVSADGVASDPLPHILAGIPLNVRDIRVYVEKPNFTLNPTSCAESQTAATLWGGGENVFSSLDDTPVGLESRFVAVNCAKLGFKPRLSLRLRGGTRRGAHPKLRGLFRPRAGDANLKDLVVRFPRSAFLDQGHIRTICTRVQYAAAGGNGAGCPEAAIYGHAIAYSPLLDEPLQGPVYLRSSSHKLPDFVAALHGIIDVETVARIDSKRGGIRATFTDLPDAPLTKVIVAMQGGRKGLIVNSTDLCRGRHRADVRMAGHNGKRHGISPLVRPTCKKARKASKSHHRRAG